MKLNEMSIRNVSVVVSILSFPVFANAATFSVRVGATACAATSNISLLANPPPAPYTWQNLAVPGDYNWGVGANGTNLTTYPYEFLTLRCDVPNWTVTPNGGNAVSLQPPAVSSLNVYVHQNAYHLASPYAETCGRNPVTAQATCSPYAYSPQSAGADNSIQLSALLQGFQAGDVANLYSYVIVTLPVTKDTSGTYVSALYGFTYSGSY